MSELIAKYLENPNEENLKKLTRYVKQHSMAVCFASPKELKVLRKLGLGI